MTLLLSSFFSDYHKLPKPTLAALGTPSNTKHYEPLAKLELDTGLGRSKSHHPV